MHLNVMVSLTIIFKDRVMKAFAYIVPLKLNFKIIYKYIKIIFLFFYKKILYNISK